LVCDGGHAEMTQRDTQSGERIFLPDEWSLPFVLMGGDHRLTEAESSVPGRNLAMCKDFESRLRESFLQSSQQVCIMKRSSAQTNTSEGRFATD
jgi:D-aminopeptidase